MEVDETKEEERTARRPDETNELRGLPSCLARLESHEFTAEALAERLRMRRI